MRNIWEEEESKALMSRSTSTPATKPKQVFCTTTVALAEVSTRPHSVIDHEDQEVAVNAVKEGGEEGPSRAGCMGYSCSNKMATS